MARYCEDCGTRYSNGMCPNCCEELFMETTQGEFLPDSLSDSWREKVKAQQKKVRSEQSLSRFVPPVGDS